MAATPLSFTHLLCLLIASISFFPTFSAAWIVTQYYEEIISIRSAYTEAGYTESAYTYTNIEYLSTPTGSAISTTTVTHSSNTADFNDDTYTIIEVLYPQNAEATASASATLTGTAVDSGETSISGYQYTSYVVNLTYTAPTSCSTSWTYATAVPVDPPYEIEDALVPTSVSTSYYTDVSEPFQATTLTTVFAYLDPTQVPATSMASLSSSYAPYPSCYNPNLDSTNDGSSASASSSSSSSSSSSTNTYCDYYGCDGDDDDDDNSSWINDSSVYGISPLAIILITVLGWTFVIFVIGLFENYFHFQRLMKGWQARRGLPITWWFWIVPISCLVCLGLSRRGFQARSEEDAAELCKKWEEMGFWRRKTLWLRHGFGWAYPPMLGPAPPRVGRPSKAPVPTQPLLQVSPPASEQPSRQPLTDAADVDIESASASASAIAGSRSQPEMSGGLSPQTLQVPSPTTTRAPRTIPAPIAEQDEITEVATPADNQHVNESQPEVPNESSHNEAPVNSSTRE